MMYEAPVVVGRGASLIHALKQARRLRYLSDSAWTGHLSAEEVIQEVKNREIID